MGQTLAVGMSSAVFASSFSEVFLSGFKSELIEQFVLECPPQLVHCRLLVLVLRGHINFVQHHEERDFEEQTQQMCFSSSSALPHLHPPPTTHPKLGVRPVSPFISAFRYFLCPQISTKLAIL